MTTAALEAVHAALGADHGLLSAAGRGTFLTSAAMPPRSALELRDRAARALAASGWSAVVVDASAYDALMKDGGLAPVEPADGASPAVQQAARAIFEVFERRLIEDDEELADDGGDEESGLDAHRTALGEIDPSFLAAPLEKTFHFLQQEKSVRVFLLPVAQHLVVAALGFGGFNEAPGEVENRVVHAYWHSAYGAVAVYVGDDYIELSAARSPTTVDQLRQLVWEQYVYCTDIVEQGTETLPQLAREVMQGKWFFWWD